MIVVGGREGVYGEDLGWILLIVGRVRCCWFVGELSLGYRGRGISLAVIHGGYLLLVDGMAAKGRVFQLREV